MKPSSQSAVKTFGQNIEDSLYQLCERNFTNQQNRLSFYKTTVHYIMGDHQKQLKIVIREMVDEDYGMYRIWILHGSKWIANGSKESTICKWMLSRSCIKLSRRMMTWHEKNKSPLAHRVGTTFYMES